MKRILILLAAVVALATVGAGSAQAKSVRFWATFRAEKTIRWAEPKWYGHTDCYHRWWTRAGGTQTETYRSTMPVRVLLYTSGLDSSSTYLKWRTWDQYDEGSTRPMPGMGKIDRSASRTTDWEAGTCGVRGVIIDDEGNERTTPVPPRPGDCGVRQPAVYANVSFDKRGAELSVSSAGRDQDPLMGSYRECELQKPIDLQELRWDSRAFARFSRTALFNPDLPAVTLRGSQAAHQQWFVGNMAGLIFASGSVTWSVTLRRAKIPVITGRKRR